MASGTRPHCPIIWRPMVLCNVRYRPYKERSTEGYGGHFKYSTVLSAFHILGNSSCNHGCFTCRTVHYQPRTRLDLLFPQIADRIENQQSREEKLHDCIAQQCDFAQGQVVYARNFREGERWIPGHIVEVTCPVSYNVEVEDGRHWKRHKDHIRSRLVVPDN